MKLHFSVSCQIFGIATLLLSGISTFSLDFYVNPKTGSPNATGTIEDPFRTIQQAQQAVRAQTESGQSEHITVHLSAGDFQLETPLTFDALDGGQGTWFVFYQGETGTRIFSGVTIRNWSVAENGFWSSRHADADSSPVSLYVEGIPRPRSRHPNQGFLRVDTVVNDRNSFTNESNPIIPPPDKPSNALLGLLHDWSMSYVPLKNIQCLNERQIISTASVIGGPYPFWRINGFEPNPRYFLENAPEWIDSPGEWSFDQETREILYKPMPGESLESFNAFIPRLETLVKIQGNSTNQVRNLIFKNIGFEHTQWSPFENRYAGGQAGFHWDGVGANPNQGSWNPIQAAIHVSHSRNVQFQSCQFSKLGGSGVWFEKNCQHGEVSDCSFSQIAANAILLGEENPSIDQVSGNHLVYNNLIENCGQRYFGSVGIWIGLSPGNRVIQNEIRDLPYTGISVGWSWSPAKTVCADNRIVNNHIHHVMQKLSDGGGIYTLGRQPGTVLSGNRIHDIPLNLGRAESNGMFLDEGTMGIVIENNRIYGTIKSPLRFHKAETNFVQNNDFTLPKGIPMIRFNNMDESKIIIKN